MSNATTYRRCRATVASRPTWENRPCGNTRGLQWDAKRGCYWCHAHRPKYITPTPKARETEADALCDKAVTYYDNRAEGYVS